MLNYLWGFMIIIGIIVGACTGNIAEVGNASIESSKEAVALCVTMLGVMSFWMGLMEVAKSAGIIDGLTKMLRPILKLLFPDIPREHVVNEYIASNMIANLTVIIGLSKRKWIKNKNIFIITPITSNNKFLILKHLYKY